MTTANITDSQEEVTVVINGVYLCTAGPVQVNTEEVPPKIDWLSSPNLIRRPAKFRHTVTVNVPNLRDAALAMLGSPHGDQGVAQLVSMNESLAGELANASARAVRAEVEAERLQKLVDAVTAVGNDMADRPQIIVTHDDASRRILSALGHSVFRFPKTLGARFTGKAIYGSLEPTWETIKAAESHLYVNVADKRVHTEQSIRTHFRDFKHL